MPPRLDLAGQRFGRLLAIKRSHQDKFGAWLWLCICACGKRVLVRGSTLNAGRTSACASCATSAASTTHGATGTPLYQRWRAMLDRCENPCHRGWRDYGGRGIKVCNEWHQFEAFARDMGPTFEVGLELDRIDVDGHYEVSNCRWVTHAEQQRNKRSNHLITWSGRTMVVTDWAVALGIKPNTLVYRLRRGWPLDRAMTAGVSADVLLELANGGDQ